MMYATATTTRTSVIPTRTIRVRYRYRCLSNCNGRIVEYPTRQLVRYPFGERVVLMVVKIPKNRIWYVDKHGWMIEENELTKLIARNIVCYE